MIPYLLADDEPVSTPDLVRAMAEHSASSRVLRRFAGDVAIRRRVHCARASGGTPGRIARGRHHGVSPRFGWTPPISLADGMAAALRETPPL
jgi:hypothetical protein